MNKLILVILAVLFAGSAQAAILCESLNGGSPYIPASLSVAATSNSCQNTSVVVTSALSAVQSNISSATLHAWPADRTLKISTGGSISNTTEFAFVDSNKFETVIGYVFKGSGKISGLKETRAEYFGAVGNGNTDDYIPIYRALESLQTVGGTLILDSKSYAIGTMILIDQNWLKAIHVKGNGPQLSSLKFLSTGVNSSLFYYHNGPDGSSFTNFAMVGSWAYTSPYTEISNNNAFWLRTEGANTKNLLFDRLEVSYFGYDALQLMFVDEARVTNSSFHHCAFEGVLISLNSKRNVVENNVFYQLKWGVDLNASDTLVKGNVFKRMLPAYQTWGMTIERNEETTDTGRIQVVNNIFDDVGDVGLNISAPPTATWKVNDVLVANNIFKINTTNDAKFGSGIIMTNTNNVQVVNNSITDCRSTSTGDGIGVGIKTVGGTNIHIANNYMRNIDDSAIVIGTVDVPLGLSSGITIQHNQISSSPKGIRFRDTLSASNISFNTFTDISSAVYVLNDVAPTTTPFFMNNTFGCTAVTEGTLWPTAAPVWNVDINGNLAGGFLASDTSAGLSVNLLGKGIGFPNLTTTQKNALTPSPGLTVFDTTLDQLQVYRGGLWQSM